MIGDGRQEIRVSGHQDIRRSGDKGMGEHVDGDKGTGGCLDS
jgi:hypothetical protein